MSARQRFISNSKGVSKQQNQGDSGNNDEANACAPSETTAETCSGSTGALTDASNSPRPGRKNIRDGSRAHKNNGDKEMSVSVGGDSDRASTGIAKPLNVSLLTRARAKKGGETAPNQGNEVKNPTTDRLKENDQDPPIRSPRARAPPMSPRRRPENSSLASPFMFGPEPNMVPTNASGAHILTNDQKDHSHAQYGRLPIPSPGIPLSANGHMHTIGFSPSVSRPYHEPLDPAKSEIFPMRLGGGSTDLTHIRDSMSPLPSGEQWPSEGRVYDFQVPFDKPSINNTNVPINVDTLDTQARDDYNEKHDQPLLRRSTKRIGQHTINGEDAPYGREGKRTKTDAHTNDTEVMYEHRMSAHGGQQHQSSVQSQAYDSHVRQIHQGSPLAQVATQALQPTPPDPELQQNHALYRLFGVDMEQYFSEHVEQYEIAKKRWTSCSIEEWQTGADEITGKFSKLIDFVKDHMTTKLSLFASLHGRVNDHKAVLAERDTALKNMREKLVKDSGVFLEGGGIPK
ncbi:hypothetical protein M0805_002357 [Coniferiporia weirii]|nr:hypothetical protein M0805_002357 [Coniferiporia weirii]